MKVRVYENNRKFWNLIEIIDYPEKFEMIEEEKTKMKTTKPINSQKDRENNSYFGDLLSKEDWFNFLYLISGFILGELFILGVLLK